MQIDNDPDSGSYGQLLVDDMNDIDVFTARNKLNEKMAEIQRLAQLPEEDEDNCNALLSELVTACGDRAVRPEHVLLPAVGERGLPGRAHPHQVRNRADGKERASFGGCFVRFFQRTT